MHVDIQTERKKGPGVPIPTPFAPCHPDGPPAKTGHGRSAAEFASS